MSDVQSKNMYRNAIYYRAKSIIGSSYKPNSKNEFKSTAFSQHHVEDLDMSVKVVHQCSLIFYAKYPNVILSSPGVRPT